MDAFYLDSPIPERLFQRDLSNLFILQMNYFLSSQSAGKSLKKKSKQKKKIMNLSLSFHFNSKLAKIKSFARFALIFEKVSHIQLKTHTF